MNGMKNIKYLFGAVLLIALTGCNDDPNPAENSIIGKWRWVSSTGGIAGVTITPASEGHTMFIEFTEDSTYRKYVADTLQFEVLYSITEGQSIFSTEPVPMIDFGPQRIKQAILELESNKLFLAEDCFDCFGHTFSRHFPID